MNRKIIGKISSSLIKADASYIPFHKYNPLINYDWSTKNINGLRYLADKGELPKYDARLYFGQGVYFNGVDQCVSSKTFGELNVPMNPPEVTICAYISDVTSGVIWNTGFASGYGGVSLQVNSGKISINSNSTENATLDTPYISGMVVCTLKNNVWSIYINGILKVSRLFTYTTPFSFSATQVFSIGAYRVSAMYCTGKIKDVSMFTRALTQSEITQSYEQPEAFYAMSQADVTCVLNMPMCENDGYVRNMKTYSEGVNFVGNTLEYSTAGSGNSIVQNNNIFNITNTVSTGQTYSPYVKFSPNVFTSDLYYQEIEVVCLSGTMQVNSMEGVPKNTYNEVLVAGQTKTYSRVSQFADIGGQKGVITFNGINHPTFTARITLKNIRKITNGIQPIQNYTTACRTSAQNLSYGLQTCKFNRDSLGVIKGINVGIECRGIGYATTGWTPPINDNFSIECIMNFNNDLQYNFNGSQISSTNRFMFGQDITGLNARLLVNSKNVLANSIGVGYHLFSITRSGTTFNLSIDGIFIGSITETLLALNSFYLGRANPGSYSLTNNNIRLFKVHDKALTQAEITKNYNSYVAKGLLA